MENWRSYIQEVAPLIKNQEPHAFATYSKNPLYKSFVLFCFVEIKQYMYNINDKIRSGNMYTWNIQIHL